MCERSYTGHVPHALTPVPIANPMQLADARESGVVRSDERALQIYLVHLDRAVSIAGCVGSRNSRASASAQRSAAQLPETGELQQHRPAGACQPLSAGPEVLDAHKIISPATLMRWHRAGFQLYW